VAPISAFLALSLAASLWGCGDKSGTGDSGSVTDGGTTDGGTTDGGTTDGGGSDGGATTTDVDGDGYSVADGDCDDNDPAVHPGAPDEPYDGLDSNCDGLSDFDWDGDGFDSAAYGGDDCNDADASIHPGASDTPYDGIDQDCAGNSDFDADGDGYISSAYAGDDCDDANPERHPGAYDRPNDGLDQDCDGADRSFDGVVLDSGATTTWDVVVSLDGYGQLDVAVLLDTTCSMSSSLGSLDFADIADALSSTEVDVAYGFATFDDYPYGSMGSGGTDHPFQLREQVTDDISAVQTAVDAASLHSGGDSPEATVEALYQALSGAGYDMACDGSYSSTYDVRPFLAAADDPFGGTGGESYVDTVTGGGLLGGMGFRDGSVPLIIYVTDASMRDPDGLLSSSTSTPGGCPMDAGSTDIALATTETGAVLMGVSVGSTPLTGMNTLSDMTGSAVDLDGDGTADPLVSTWSSTSGTLGAHIGAAVAAIADTLAGATVIGDVHLEKTLDGYGLVTDISPDPATDIDTSTTTSQTFTLTLYGAVPATTVPLDVTVILAVYIDGEHVDDISLDVEIPPI